MLTVDDDCTSTVNGIIDIFIRLLIKKKKGLTSTFSCIFKKEASSCL